MLLFLSQSQSSLSDYNSEYLDLIDRKYEAESDLLGAGGQEIFKFKGLQLGMTEIKFIYARPWESIQPLEKRTYNIGIE